MTEPESRRGRRRRGHVALLAAVVLPAAALLGCAAQERDASPPRQTRTGDPARGAELISHYGCGTCHEVPGVDGADGMVGPPLDHFSRRGYIAGELPNSATNLDRWIENPQRIEPGTAMPYLGVSHRDAQDITAYLYSLK
jgi:cytochrome c2